MGRDVLALLFIPMSIIALIEVERIHNILAKPGISAERTAYETKNKESSLHCMQYGGYVFFAYGYSGEGRGSGRNRKCGNTC